MGSTYRAAHISNPFQAYGAPAGNTLAAIGDSFLYRDRIQDGTTYYWTQGTGPMLWMQQFLRRPLTVLNYDGVQGETYTAMARRMSGAVLKYQTRFAMIQGGTNDANSVVTAADAIRYFRAWRDKLVRPCIDRGIIPIVNTPPPSNLTSLSSAAKIAGWKYLAQATRDYCGTQGGIILGDFAGRSYLDPSDSNGVVAVAGNVISGTDLHPMTLGALKLGKCWADQVANYQLNDLRLVTNNDAYNAVSNPMMYGTAGTNGTGSSGNVADTWTCATFGGGTTAVVCSKVAATDGGNPWQRQVFTTSAAPAAPFGTDLYSAPFTLTGDFAVGDYIEFGGSVRISSGHTGLLGVSAYLQNISASVNTFYSRRYLDLSSDSTFAADELVNLNSVYGPPMPIRSGTTDLRIALRVTGKTSTSTGFTIDARDFFIRKVSGARATIY